MRIRLSFLFLSLLSFAIFTFFSYTVAKEFWQQTDFDFMVKLQDHISREYDEIFSYFSLLGSAEITIGISLIFSVLYLLRLKFLSLLGWLIIIPASMVEVIGKLFIFHPGPSVLFNRTVLETHLPSFYVHTNFSYPSGHVTRTIFLATVFLVLLIHSANKLFVKIIGALTLIGFSFMMILTRVVLGEHWLSDVIGGTFLGLSAGLFAAVLIIQDKKSI